MPVCTISDGYSYVPAAAAGATVIAVATATTATTVATAAAAVGDMSHITRAAALFLCLGINGPCA